MNTSTTSRLSALIASIAITFTILSLVVDLSRPAQAETQAAAEVAVRATTAA
jgi:hypothetical protein